MRGGGESVECESQCLIVFGKHIKCSNLNTPEVVKKQVNDVSNSIRLLKFRIFEIVELLANHLANLCSLITTLAVCKFRI